MYLEVNMTRNSRVLAFISVALFAAMPIAATESPGQADAPVTIRILTRWSDQSGASTAFRNRLQSFMEEHPDIIIEDLSINDESSFTEKAKVMIASGDVPEIVQNYGGAGSKIYFESDVFVDLKPYLDGDPDWASGFVPLFGEWEFDDLPGIWGVPYEVFAISLFYNRAILEEVGLEPPETVEELMEQGEALRSAGYIPISTGVADSFRGGHLFTNLLIKRHGPELVERLNRGTASFEDQEVVEILTFMKTMQDEGMLGENITAVNYAADNALFGSGETAMHFDGSWFLSDGSLSLIDAGVVPFPYFESSPQHRNVVMGGSAAGLVVGASEDPDKLDAAITLLKYLTSVEHFAYIREFTGGGVYPVKLPPTDSVDSVTVEYADSYSEAETFIGDIGNGVPLPQMVEVTRNAIQGLFAGAISPEEAASQMAREHEQADFN